MSALLFELKGKPDQRLDLSPLVPAKLKDLKPKEIEALVVGTTRDKLSVGDCFIRARIAHAARCAGVTTRPLMSLGLVIRGASPARYCAR